jgi:hypothetical protein
MSRFPSWVWWSVMMAVVLFSPALAFLLAIAAEILIGLLIEANAITVCAITGGAIGWVLFRKMSRSKSPASLSDDDEASLGGTRIAPAA